MLEDRQNFLSAMVGLQLPKDLKNDQVDLQILKVAPVDPLTNAERHPSLLPDCWGDLKGHP